MLICKSPKKIIYGQIKLIKPKPLWSYFEEILKVPRPSRKEEKIREFLIDFAKEHALDYKTDEAGNLLITKPATEELKTGGRDSAVAHGYGW